MASAALLSLSAALLLLSLLSGAVARPGPCKTLFISYTITSSDPTLDLSTADPSPYASFAVFRIVRPLRPYYYSASSFHSLRRPIRLDRPHIDSDPAVAAISSLQERAKDILFVVVGLLFGVGCGALTAATIYLAWSLVMNRYEVCGSEGFSDGEEDESPKKMGYVKIAGPAPAAVKEGYEGN